MAETDSPLKILVREFAPDFAAWLLNVDPAAIQHVRVLNIELPAGKVSSDTILRGVVQGFAPGGVVCHAERVCDAKSVTANGQRSISVARLFAGVALLTTLSRRPAQSDMSLQNSAPHPILRVALAGGHDVLLHVEFQGKDSERPMPWRMVDYLGRIAERELDYRHLERLSLCGVVFYVGEGAGAHDSGAYQSRATGGGGH
jgi:hypothetical protein